MFSPDGTSIFASAAPHGSIETGSYYYYDSSPVPKTKGEIDIQDHTTNTFDSSPVPKTKGEIDRHTRSHFKHL